MGTVGRRRTSGPRELTRVGERLSFLYLERCVVHRDSNAITAEDGDGTRYLPSATIGTLLLGPGTNVTHSAMSLLGECGATVVWVGEHGVRYYAAGRALTRSSRLVEAQATAWANRRSRLDVARAMYRMRFPDLDVEALSRQALLGKEGDRVKACYREQAARTGVTWRGRRYVPGDHDVSDPPNKAITAAAQCFYGVAHAVTAALGCSPGLGFVHSGHERGFVMDVADLYKVEIGIPVAFDAAAQGDEDVDGVTRRLLRDRINEEGLLERCVRDIKALLLGEGSVGAQGEAEDAGESANDDVADTVGLVGDRGELLESGYSYADEVVW
ncbi:type I-E CRISPR-associated endonuclease Cas1e [Nocardiopsis dassonvillei]|uniref:CRISPR-associated endonuclease Cas1 n=1 Tax=Nocardiopsis dassonvillei (strain ATCC 23218 / DSM 43111 / CIP 107115 / JCM 7437 / KCTC 9190 / NBRC 14626 / NCTC 10488 / NRRL B-5397 / IMRU 509) TaxID=446468 RepID=D7B2M6_NOCDD|nr:type I-E CRISPR-associated endonuclease Cas1e [Nocardiopsis dassonvillei]ADH66724.1 CRISPR-associated protein Cas1 [Nocardiopsis dassonvillei subsp. dassonvillei DSM 43111]NKY80810.1 type I-E CRISPR-associated endonuclease Cas1 [Nocardiopsis dassonvillei]